MRSLFVGLLAMAAVGCTPAPSAGQPTLDVRLSPSSTTLNTTKGLVRLTVAATDAAGQVGQGIVDIEPDFGTVSESSVMLDAFGKAEITYSCLSSVDPRCGIERNSTVLVRWAIRPAVSVTRKFSLRSQDELDAMMPTIRLDGGTGSACTTVTDCQTGLTCFEGTCVGAGDLRVSLNWMAASDFDLHVVTPSGREIFFANRTAEGGELDVDACVSLPRCRPTNVENIFWQLAAPRGRYRIFVVNYNGAAAGPFRIQVAGVGLAPQEFMGALGATAGSRSTDFFIDR